MIPLWDVLLVSRHCLVHRVIIVRYRRDVVLIIVSMVKAAIGRMVRGNVHIILMVVMTMLFVTLVIIRSNLVWVLVSVGFFVVIIVGVCLVREMRGDSRSQETVVVFMMHNTMVTGVDVLRNHFMVRGHAVLLLTLFMVLRHMKLHFVDVLQLHVHWLGLFLSFLFLR